MISSETMILPDQADVLVIGSGLAGTAAAYEAAKAGAGVLVLEKMSYNGGNSALAGGGYACYDSGLKMREKLGLGEDSWERHMEDTLKAGKYLNDPLLVETLVKNAPAGMDWLTAAGVPFKDVLVKLGGYSAPRAYQAACSGKEMMDLTRAFAESAGVRYIYECEVTGLIREENGPISGVTCVCQGREQKIAASKAVIITSGGFSQDVPMRMSVRPDLDESFKCSNHKGATGEMIRYAREIGADTVQLDKIQLYPCANPDTGSVDRWAFYCYSGAGFGMIYVDGQGRRFVNELEGRAHLTEIQIRQCKKPTWAVLNQEIVEKLGMTEQEVATGERLGRMPMGETIRELAEKTGMDPEILEQTIREHDTMIQGEGIDPFGKAASPAFAAMEHGPYYAIPQWPAVHFTLGGLKIDKEAHVIDTDGNIIPGLFAAGEVCGGVHGADRMGGNALAECVVFGRIAGTNAAKSEDGTGGRVLCPTGNDSGTRGRVLCPKRRENMNDEFWKGKHYSFFQNKECEFFPCHKVKDPDDFNCLFCYCPLYVLGENCGGNFRINEKGIKDCTGCSLPHARNSYGYVTGKFQEIVKAMQKIQNEKE